MWTPMPAAVPLTAAITGFSQSKMAEINFWAPTLMPRATSMMARSGAPDGRT